jgi:plasmid stabilization system protein ParE
MTFRLELTEQAESDLTDYADWIAQDSRSRAWSWYEATLNEIGTLSEMPLRYPLAYEAEPLQRPIRQMIVGQHRVLFTVDKADKVVYVLRVWPAARRLATSHDLPDHNETSP